MSNTTRLLAEWRQGSEGAFDALFDNVYEDLKSVAHHRIVAQSQGGTINTTLLVHEAYVRLVDGDGAAVQDRAHFMAVASRAMRFILVDYARAQNAQKRGGADRPVPLDGVQVAGPEQASVELIALNDALERLSEYDERLGRIVECRFFGGMEYEEIAQATGLSVPTLKRDWARARAWLYDFMSDDSEDS